MAERRNSSGLSAGQLITLTFGFLLASVVIFVFGLWVGRDLAERRHARQGEILRVQVGPAPVVVTGAAGGRTALPTPVVPLAPTQTAALPTVTTEPTVTRPRQVKTATAVPVPETMAPGSRLWTVQVDATNDQVQAIVRARELRSKGYDAYTVQASIGVAKWYRLQVGRFSDRAAAKAVAKRLRKDEGFEAAFVTQMR